MHRAKIGYWSLLRRSSLVCILLVPWPFCQSLIWDIFKQILSMLSFKFSTYHTFHLVLIWNNHINRRGMGQMFMYHGFTLVISNLFLLSYTKDMLTTWIYHISAFWIYELFLKSVLYLNKLFVCRPHHLTIRCSFRLDHWSLRWLVLYWKNYFFNLTESLSLGSLIWVERSFRRLVVSTVYM